MNKIFNYYDDFLSYVVILLNYSCMKMTAVATKPFSIRFSVSEQIIFYKRLAMLLQASVPIQDALLLLASDTTNKASNKIITSVAISVSEGIYLSDALKKFKPTVSDYICNIIAVGEASGSLVLNLEYLSKELKKRQELKKQILGALLYPAIIIIATVGISTFLLLYIFPKIIPIFLSLHSDLPLSTKLLINFTNWLKTEWWLLILLGFVIFVIFTAVKRISYTEMYLNAVLLKIPILGTMVRYYNITNSSRVIGLLIEHNVRISYALSIAAASTRNVLYKKSLQTAVVDIAAGKTLTSSLRTLPWLWSPLVLQMLEVSERTGSLGTTCIFISELYENDIRELTKNLTTLLEPFLMLFMGLCVGFIAISIITPIYGITSHLHQ